MLTSVFVADPSHRRQLYRYQSEHGSLSKAWKGIAASYTSPSERTRCGIVVDGWGSALFSTASARTCPQQPGCRNPRVRERRRRRRPPTSRPVQA